MKDATIWIPQEPMRKLDGEWVRKEIDIASASEFGQIQVIWPPDAPILTQGVVAADAMRVARSYDQTRDYIIALGSPSLIAMLGWALGKYNKQLRMLEWSKQARRYYPTVT